MKANRRFLGVWTLLILGYLWSNSGYAATLQGDEPGNSRTTPWYSWDENTLSAVEDYWDLSGLVRNSVLDPWPKTDNAGVDLSDMFSAEARHKRLSVAENPMSLNPAWADLLMHGYAPADDWLITLNCTDLPAPSVPDNSPIPIPEPASATLILMGLATAAWRRKRD